MRLDGKTAVITGASSGCGWATAQTLADAGANVLLGDIDENNGERCASEIRAKGGDADFIRLDVTDLESIDAFKQEAYRKHEQVDIVSNVAGWDHKHSFIENTPEFWQKVIAINLLGPIAVSRAFLDRMMERKFGRIINVASDAGRVGNSGECVYSGAKGGVIAFSKALAREMARYSINVNVVCPGAIDTPLLHSVTEKEMEAFMRATPLRRLGKPSEIADAILFFASDRSNYITGQVLSVSGGLTMVD